MKHPSVGEPARCGELLRRIQDLAAHATRNDHGGSRFQFGKSLEHHQAVDVAHHQIHHHVSGIPFALKGVELLRIVRDAGLEASGARVRQHHLAHQVVVVDDEHSPMRSWCVHGASVPCDSTTWPM